MPDTLKRSTIYLSPEIHKALKIKAASTHRSVSALVDEAVRQSLREDQEDLATFKMRTQEPLLSYEELLDDLKAHGKL